MLATFVLTHPTLAAAAVAVSFGLLTLFYGRRARRPGDGWRIGTGVAGLIAGTSALLAPTQVTALFLTPLGLAGGAWLIAVWYSSQTADRSTRVALVVARCSAWAAVFTLLARPACDRELVVWERPVLAVLLDQSASLGIRDGGENQPARVERAHAALHAASAAIRQIDERYDVHLFGFGTQATPLSQWQIVPRAPATALVPALRTARELRSTRGQPPVAVLLISDGGENVTDAATVRRAGTDFVSQRTALFSVGVGPPPGQVPRIELDPLAVPPRVGLRDTFVVPVRVRAQGVRGELLALQLLWNDDPFAEATLRPDYEMEHLRREFEALPPTPGVHRLTARVTLPPARGGQVFEVSTLVEVAQTPIRVLYVESAPRQESAFILRALRAADDVEVTPLFIMGGGRAELWQTREERGRDWWTSYDVIILGRLRSALPRSALTALADGVERRGVGLLLAGGFELLASDNVHDSPLTPLLPAALRPHSSAELGALQFLPTSAGLEHPALRDVSGLLTEDELRGPTAREERQRLWTRLPALGGAARIEARSPLATILAMDGTGRPLLVTQEIGRGRGALAAWEQTWPWVLASDEGREVHRQVWQQLTLWLANRRPRAWVTSDRARYDHTTLLSAGAKIAIFAGVSGLGTEERVALAPRLTVRRILHSMFAAEHGPPLDSPLPLVAEGATWTTTLPHTILGTENLEPGTYELALEVQSQDGATWEATGRFEIVAEDLERRPPTADLALLRSVAAETTTVGGLYRDITELPSLLADLARQDRRERYVERIRYDVVERDPWGVLGWLLTALAVEWLVRKRAGMT